MPHLTIRTLLIFVFLVSLPFSDRTAKAASIEKIEVVGTEFIVHLTNGTSLGSAQLVGAVLTLEDGTRLRIDGVEADPADAGGDVLLHNVSFRDADGTWQPYCTADPYGERFAMPIAGHLLDDGSLDTRQGSFQIICTSGAQGKCVRYGYKPWLEDQNGRPMLDFFNACVRMLRADYCGDGTSTTIDGTLIYIYDRIGVQPYLPIEGMDFEAAWSDEGATCISRVRIADNVSLQQLLESCPRLQNVPIGESCTEAEAERDTGSLIFNSSYPH